jgi:hypothetical protein
LVIVAPCARLSAVSCLGADSVADPVGRSGWSAGRDEEPGFDAGRVTSVV